MKTIIVTVENQDSFKELKQCRDIIVRENAWNREIQIIDQFLTATPC